MEGHDRRVPDVSLKPDLHVTSLLPCPAHYALCSFPQGYKHVLSYLLLHFFTFLPPKNAMLVATAFEEMLHSIKKKSNQTEMYTLNKPFQQMELKAFIILLRSGTFQVLCLQ